VDFNTFIIIKKMVENHLNAVFLFYFIYLPSTLTFQFRYYWIRLF